MSTAIIVKELTGQLHLTLPTVVCVLFAYYTGKNLTLPCYDIFLVGKRNSFSSPAAPVRQACPVPSTHAYARVDNQVMQPQARCADSSEFKRAHIPLGRICIKSCISRCCSPSDIEKAIEKVEHLVVLEELRREERAAVQHEERQRASSLAARIRKAKNDARIERKEPLLSGDEEAAIDNDEDISDMPLWFQVPEFAGDAEGLISTPAPFRGCRKLPVEPSPLTISPAMSLSMVHKLFQMLQLSSVIVVKNSHVVGVINRVDMMKWIEK